MVADKGSWYDGLKISDLEKNGPELIVCVPRHKGEQEESFDAFDPEQASDRQTMQYKLQTDRGKEIYGLRGRTVETAFGQIKAAMGCKAFLRRGIEAVKSEWLLICACFNPRKLYKVKYSS